jgi:hypothetical protein
MRVPVTIAVAALSTVGMFASVQEASAWRACGPRGCAAGGGYYAPRGRVVVVQPRRYWAPGGAIAAGAAVGFIAGAAAVALAGPAPKPGYCWYYTTPAQTSGFWDRCPG